MTTSSNSTELTNNDPPATTTDPGTGYADPVKKTEIALVDPAEPKLDDNGYEIIPDPADAVKTEPKTPVADPEPVKVDPSSGYSKDQKFPDPTKKTEVDPDPKEPVTDEVKLKADIDEALGDYADKELISQFAIDNKMTKEQVTAYVALMKTEDSKAVEHEENNRKEIRSGWKKELMDDTTFGGDNFDINVDRVEKVLTNFMPNTRKVLTDRGNMLPPYIMRDLLTISKSLNPTTVLVNGDPSKPVKKENDNFLDGMYE